MSLIFSKNIPEEKICQNPGRGKWRARAKKNRIIIYMTDIGPRLDIDRLVWREGDRIKNFPDFFLRFHIAGDMLSFHNLINLRRCHSRVDQHEAFQNGRLSVKGRKKQTRQPTTHRKEEGGTAGRRTKRGDRRNTGSKPH